MVTSIYSRAQKSLIERLKKARISSELRQAVSSARLKKSQSYISKLKAGQRRIDVVELQQLAALHKKELK